MQSYAAPRCLAWMLAFQERDLPREIRNLIYSSLADVLKNEDGTHLCIGPSHPRSEVDEHPPAHYVTQGLQRQSWIMDPDFVGLDLAGEIAQIYYAEFSFWLNGSQFQPCLDNYDPLKVGFQPFDYITKLTILEMTDFNSLHENLMHLCTIRRKDKFRVDLRFLVHDTGHGYIGVEDMKSMLRLLEDIRYPVYELIHSGSNVHV